MSRHGWRPHIESALCLDVRRLFALGAIRPGQRSSGCWQWNCDGRRLASVAYSSDVATAAGTLALNYADANGKPVQCSIRLTSIPLHYGGRRWFLHCPYTDRRAEKLYKFEGIDRFCHRTAIRPLPTYASQRVSGAERAMAQRWALRRRLGDSLSTLFEEPFKPRWMRRHTFERYRSRDDLLAEREGRYFTRLLGRLRAKLAG